MQERRTFIISELPRNTNNTQLLGRRARILAKKAKLVPDLDDEDGIFMFAFNIHDLFFQRSQLLCFSFRFFRGCRCRCRSVFVVVFSFYCFDICSRASPPSNSNETVWTA